MEATIAEVLDNPSRYADQVVNIDGVLLVAAFNRAGSRFEQVWLVQANTPTPRGLQSPPIATQSTLWHGLSRLTPRHVPGYQGCRIRDAARAMVRIQAASDDRTPPTFEILTAALYRPEFTLFVGEKGIRLDQALPDDVTVLGLPDIKARLSRHLKRERHVYGTLVLRSAPTAEYLLPGRIPWLTSGQRAYPGLGRDGDAAIDPNWLADIDYPQSDSTAESLESLRDSVLIDPYFSIARRLEAFPGINQTLVRPAIALGRLVESPRQRQFAALTGISQVYLQNIRFDNGDKSFESVIKLKQFGAGAA